MEKMGEGVAVFFATPEAPYGHDTHYRYRPDPDLHYLTGFPEPEAVAVIDAGKKRFTMFVRPRDRARETWEGRRAGPEGARRDYGADQAFPIGELEAKLPDLIRSSGVLWLALGESARADAIATTLLLRFRKDARNPLRGPIAVKDPTEILHEMRLFKSPDEIALMEKAAAISARAH